MADVDDYLQEGWDPRGVTMPRLRSILVTHNVDFSSTAKKAQLVQLVEDEVLPLAPRLRAQKARAKRSSMGIVNAGSAEDVNNWAEQDLAPPQSARRSKSPRKSSARSARVKSEEVDERALFSPPKRASRSVSRALSHADEESEAPTPKAGRRVSRRTVTPSVKEESDSEPEMPADGEESFFTDDNVFQSGSSPPTTKTPRGNRRSSGVDSSRSVQSTRRTTSGNSQFAIPRQRPRRSVTPFEDIEPTEEFTPDEQLELEEAASNGEVVMPARQKSEESTGPGWLSRVVPPFILLLVGLYGAWYRQEKMAVGYCGLGRPATEVIPPNVPFPEALLEFVEPQCEQCPPHAYCYDNFVARCEPDFILRSHPLSFGGAIPLVPTCEPDGVKAKRVKMVADKAVEELRERRAKYECGELKDDEGHVEDSPSINEEELKQTVSRLRSKKMNSAEFEDLWKIAIGEVTAREEIEAETITTPDSSAIPNRKISSTSHARIPFTCRVRRTIRQGLARNRFAIGLLIAAIASVFYLRQLYKTRATIKRDSPDLADKVIAKLAAQKKLGLEDEEEDEWLFLPNLRDDVLRHIHSPSKREQIWQAVIRIVERNGNVRKTQRESQSGEIALSWEWIASSGTSRRRSGRPSLAPAEVRAETPESHKDMAEVKKWDEPRPIY